MFRIKTSLLAALVVLGLLASGAAQARVYIDVTSPFSRKLPLALPQFNPTAGAASDPVGAEGTRLLSADLNFTGLFDILDPKSYLGPPQAGNVNYRRWSRIGAELLITGNYQRAGNDLTLELRLYDVAAGKLLTGNLYDGVMADLPVMIHRFADEVMLALTGERSVFRTKIAFVGARQGDRGVAKEIYLMNFDGSSVRKLTKRGDICLYPSWSSDGKLIAYSSYVKRRPAIFIQALAGGEGKVVLNRPGVNQTPSFVPGKYDMAVTTSHTGKTNVFLIDVSGRIIKKLTDGWGIEVSPSFSPDGKEMAFVSDRGGSPQIYILTLASGQLRRVTFGFKYCAKPDWSPRGDRIAFQARAKNGGFQVTTVNPQGGNVQVLTSGWGGGEDPSWSPDGRLIAYASRRTGRYQIYVMTASGQPIRRLTNLPGNNNDPAWSPRGVAGK
ncbi:MAG: Tol-Pal system beta propeller repeat protein TolB [Desulfarculaceae bacterium]